MEKKRKLRWLGLLIGWISRQVMVIRMFTTYQILLGWKTYKQYYETDEIPDPRPTQPKKNWVKKRHLGHFSPQK